MPDPIVERLAKKWAGWLWDGRSVENGVRAAISAAFLEAAKVAMQHSGRPACANCPENGVSLCHDIIADRLQRIAGV